MIDATELLAELKQFKQQVVSPAGEVTPLELRLDELIDALAEWIGVG